MMHSESLLSRFRPQSGARKPERSVEVREIAREEVQQHHCLAGDTLSGVRSVG